MNRINTILWLSVATMAMAQSPAATSATPDASLGMVSPANRVILKVKDGVVASATVNGEPVPLDWVKRDGAGLKVVDAEGVVIGSMAKLPAEGPAALRPLPAVNPMAKIGVFTDNPGLKVQIANDRELVVMYEGQRVPAGQIKMESGELRIYSAAGDLLRIIPADSSRLEKR